MGKTYINLGNPVPEKTSHTYPPGVDPVVDPMPCVKVWGPRIYFLYGRAAGTMTGWWDQVSDLLLLREKTNNNKMGFEENITNKMGYLLSIYEP